nr:hypothetical protein [Tanacetum cinerariifolium]GEZ19095.1 hypothetical protein [Tanacetum cinerariifolium]
AVEESLKSVHDALRDPLPPVVIREPDSEKFQPLPEVQGKGKEKVSDVQVSLDLLILQTPKKVSPAEQYIFQRRTPALIKPSGHAESPSIYAKLGTLSSLQHLAKDLSFGDQFFNDKPSERENEKTTVEIEAKSMVYVIIQQDTSAIPLMTTPVIDLTSRPGSPNVHRPLQATETKNIITTTTATHPPPPQPQQSTTDSMLIKCIGELEQIMENLIQDNKYLEERDLPEADMKEILHQQIWKTNSYKAHEDHMMLYEALKKSMNRDHTNKLLTDLAEAQKRRKRDMIHRKHHLGLHLISYLLLYHQQKGQSHGSTAPSSSRTTTLGEYTSWTTTDTRLRPYVSSIPKDLHMDDNTAPDEQVHSSNDEDIKNAHISKTSDMAMFIDWFCQRQGITELKPHNLEGPAFELVKFFHPNVTIQSDFFFNKYLEYLRYGSKGGRLALSILKMKAAYYPDVGLEQMVPDQKWIVEECKYEITAMYDYIKKIILRRADFNEQIIAERDFKYLYLSNFKDLYLLNLQGHLNHLPPKDKKILTTAVNLWTKHLVIRQRVEDFQLGIESYQT